MYCALIFLISTLFHVSSKNTKNSNSIELNKLNSQTTTSLPECVPYASFTPLPLDEIKTAEDRENMGCYFMCTLIDYGAYYNGTLQFNKAVESESARHAVSDCYLGKVFNGSDCRPFYEMWECFEVQFRNVRKAVSDVRDAKAICRKEFGVAEVPKNKTLTSNKERFDQGCFVRCVSIQLKVLEDNVFNPDNLLDSFTFALRKMVIERIKHCHEETNNKFESYERYSCLYFYYYNDCNERDDV